MIKKSFDLEEIKKVLRKKGLKISKKKNINLFNINKDLKSFYYTLLTSFVIIFFFFSLPSFVDFQKNTILLSKEIENKSKSNLEKVLKGIPLDNSSQVDEGLNIKNLLEDVFKFDQLPTDTVRLTASTIEQLFKDTNYNLKDIRETKLVKPITLSLLPEEMKMIESSTKKKNLFIKIILPLILEENNRIKLDRIKLFNVLNKNKNTDCHLALTRCEHAMEWVAQPCILRPRTGNQGRDSEPGHNLQRTVECVSTKTPLHAFRCVI